MKIIKGGQGATVIRNSRVQIMADDEIESNHSDETQRTYTPGKDNENKERKRFIK